MAHEINLKEILKKNKRVNRKKLAEGLKLGEELGKLGVEKQGYSLPSPSERRRAHLLDDNESDPRTVQLRHP